MQQLKLAPLLCALILVGCASTTPQQTATPPKQAEPVKAAEPTKPQLSEEAQKALTKAESDCKAAKSSFALWTSADAALKAAQEAAKTGDSAAVIKNASYASHQATAGLTQLKYPSAELKDPK